MEARFPDAYNASGRPAGLLDEAPLGQDDRLMVLVIEHRDGRPGERETRPILRASVPPDLAPYPVALLALQTSAGNRAVTQMLARWPMLGPGPWQASPAVTDEDPFDPATQLKAGDTPELAIKDFERATVDFSRAQRRWLSANWIEYFRYVSGNPRLSWTGDVVDGTVSNALGNAVAEGAKFIRKRLLTKGGAAAGGAAAGGAIGNVPGAIIGFVVGLLIETAVGLIYDAIAGSDEDRAAAEASKRTGSLIEDKEQALQKQEEVGIAAGRQKADELRGQVAAIGNDPAKLVEARWPIRREANDTRKNLPDAANLGLAKEMLRDWVMEHAGDEEDANRSTSEAQWEGARTRVFGKGDSLDNHPQIFAFQTRGHFNDVGLDIKEIQAVTARADLEWHRGEDWMMKEYDGKRFVFNSARDPAALIRFLSSRYHRPTAAAEQAIRDGRFTLVCALDLDEDDGAVYVDEWEYTITFRGGAEREKWWAKASPPHAKQNPLQFSYSPD